LRRTLHGRRRGKALRAGQRSLMETLLPRLAVQLPAPPAVSEVGEVGESAAKLDLPALFGGTPPAGGVWLEVGFGGGEHLVWQAEHHPEVGLIGCEPYLNGVAKCLASIDRAGLANVRLFTDDARFVLAALPDSALGRAFVLFPDPWPKSRHHKRRFIQRATLDTLARVLAPGGELRLATDDPGYCRWMAERACTHPAFEWLAERPADWRQRPDDWPATRYERKLLAGHPPTFLRLRRR